MVKVAYIKTMDEKNVLCRVKVSTLDRAYQRAYLGMRRLMEELSEKHSASTQGESDG